MRLKELSLDEIADLRGPADLEECAEKELLASERTTLFGMRQPGRHAYPSPQSLSHSFPWEAVISVQTNKLHVALLFVDGGSEVCVAWPSFSCPWLCVSITRQQLWKKPEALETF